MFSVNKTHLTLSTTFSLTSAQSKDCYGQHNPSSWDMGFLATTDV